MALARVEYLAAAGSAAEIQLECPGHSGVAYWQISHSVLRDPLLEAA